MKKRCISKNTIYKYFVLCLGLFLYAIAFNFFMVPNDFVVGGVSGIAVITYKLFGFDTSLTVLILSVLLIIIGFFFCDKNKMYSSVVASFLLPFFIRITSFITKYFTFEMPVLLSVICCSILVGFALGIVFKVGFSTGGTEIIYWILDKYLKKSNGQLMSIVEGVIVLGGALAFGFQKLMYSLIILYFMSNISDRIVIGISNSKMLCIISDKNYLIQEHLKKLSFVKHFNLMTKNNQIVIYCLVLTKDYLKIYDEIKKIDNKAFISVTNTYETVGGLQYEN